MIDNHKGPGSTYAYNPRAIIEKALKDAEKANKKKVGDVVKKIKGKKKGPAQLKGPAIKPKTRGRFQVMINGAGL